MDGIKLLNHSCSVPSNPFFTAISYAEIIVVVNGRYFGLIGYGIGKYG